MPKGATSRRGRAADDGGAMKVLRFLPPILLPLAVGFAQTELANATGAGGGVALVILAAALGLGIAFSVRSGLVSAGLTLLGMVLLISASYLQVLHAQAMLLHTGAPGRGVPVGAPGAGSQTAGGGGVAPAAAASGSAASDAGVALVVADPDLAPPSLETMSVVLPCAYEGEYAAKTVTALRKHTRRERLKEIIVVDDGSEPPLELPQTMLRGGGAPVKLMRHEKTLGLIAAKKTGGDAAIGDVIVFFDCHIKPRDGWEEAFLKQMKKAGDHRTVVVPTITSLDPETWQENGFAASSKACYMLWNGDFTWIQTQGDGGDVPIMSGGLLALSRRWWQETEGYDPRMVAWGGENLDQSFRIWLCGGRIEVAEGAFVAHMWRDQNNPKTTQKYKMPTEDVMRNKARAITAWLDEFKEKTWTFPEYEDFVTGGQSIGDMSNFDHLKQKLQCKPFTHYIQRFPNVFLNSGLTPQEVFQLKEESSGLCLERAPKQHMPHDVVLAPCAGDGSAGGVSELQLWHGAIADIKKHGSPCCSGLMNWNFLQCLDAHRIHSSVATFECEITGHTASMNFRMEKDDGGQILWMNGQGCMAPSKRGTQETKHCTQVTLVPETDGAFKFQLDGLCAEYAKGLRPEDDPRFQFRECIEGSSMQLFRTHEAADGLLVQMEIGNKPMCMDAGGGQGNILPYECYTAGDNPNQIWALQGTSLVWQNPNGKAFCAVKSGVSLGFHEVPSKHIVMRTCSSKLGQNLHKVDVEGETFLLKDTDTKKCLTSAGPLSTGGAGLHMGSCDDKDRWTEMTERSQMKHIRANMCIDANDDETPILYPCHEPKAQRTQRFHYVESPPSVQARSGWEDNGRKRYFDRCLDFAPEPPVQVVVDACDSARETGVSWKKVNAFEPIEHKLWVKAKKPPPGAQPLGAYPRRA